MLKKWALFCGYC